MKKSVSWHEETLKNRIANSDRLRRELEEKLKELSAFDDANQFYSDQIHRAKVEGKKSFDREQYGVKR